VKEFSDLAQFAAHLISLETAVQIQAERALEHAAATIENKAKEELGNYQPAVGPFPAWAPLAESTLAQHKRLGVGESPLLVTGQLYASIEHEARGGEAVIGTKMDIGAYQEFGTTKIPPRPFMGPAALTSQQKVEKIMAASMVNALVGGNALLGDD
jgi:HK97 gp10 family phage protein